jgi:hypothetical protein
MNLDSIDLILLDKERDDTLTQSVYTWVNKNYLSLNFKILQPKVWTLVYITLKDWKQIVYRIKTSFNWNNLPDIVNSTESDPNLSETGFIIVSSDKTNWYFIATPIQ